MARTKKPTTTPLPDRKKKKTISLREDSPLNQKIIDELEILFEMASPKTLHQSINYIFFQYLFLASENGYPADFKHISEDFYFLQKFFTECGDG